MKRGNGRCLVQTYWCRQVWYSVLPTLMLTGVLSVSAALPFARGAIAAAPGAPMLVSQVPLAVKTVPSRLETPVQSSSHLSSGWSLFSKQKGVKPSRLSQADLPPTLEVGVLFQDISSGGFMGRTFQTRLLKDGRLQRAAVKPDGSLTVMETHQISNQQLRQFEQLLSACRFQQFNRFNYPAASGSADYITVTLSSPDSTVRYADSIQGQLPRSLQTVIQTWNQLRQSAQ